MFLHFSFESRGSVVACCLWIEVREDVCVLSEESLFLLLDSLLLEGLQLGSLSSLLVFGLALQPVHLELLLPELLDVSLVLLFAHSSLLRVHLLQPLVLSELLSHLDLELLFHFAFFLKTHGLELKLIVFGSLQLLLHSLFASSCLSLIGSEALLHFLNLKIVTQVLNILLLVSTLLLFLGKLVEYGLSLHLGLLLHGLEIVGSFLLLGSILANEFLLVLLELLLSLEKSLLLVDGEDHILLALLLLHFVNSYHFVILLNHFIDDSINVLSFLLILRKCFISQQFSIDHLLLNVSLQGIERLLLLIGSLSSIRICLFLTVQVLNID